MAKFNLSNQAWTLLNKMFLCFIIKNIFWLLLITTWVLMIFPGSIFALDILLNEWHTNGWSLKYCLSGIYLINCIILTKLLEYGSNNN